MSESLTQSDHTCSEIGPPFYSTAQIGPRFFIHLAETHVPGVSQLLPTFLPDWSQILAETCLHAVGYVFKVVCQQT